MRRLDRRLSVAPMMDWTDRHCRAFHRLLSRRVLLYTEMVTTGALLHGDAGRWLAFDARQRPLALQLGGDDPAALARCARMAEAAGFDEIDLNVGCPSDRVQKGRFGACLMRHPELVAAAVAAMRAAVSLPVTVKHRIGVDELDHYEDMERFVETVAAAGCRTFIVHARKAWLSGLSPKENRQVPPLRYDDVHRLKRKHPELEIVLNGGVETLAAAREHLRHVDGVMIGRAAYHQPYLLAAADREIFGEPATLPSRRRIVHQLLPYVDSQVAGGEPLHRITRHLLGLYHGQPGGRIWRRRLTEGGHRPGAGGEVLREALETVERVAERVDRAAAAAGAVGALSC